MIVMHYIPPAFCIIFNSYNRPNNCIYLSMYLGWSNKETYLAHLALLAHPSEYSVARHIASNARSCDDHEAIGWVLEPLVDHETLDKTDLDEIAHYILGEIL